MISVFILLIIEQLSRRRMRYHNPNNTNPTSKMTKLHGSKAVIAIVICFMPPLLGFIIPVAQLSEWAVMTGEKMIDAYFWKLAANSFYLAFCTSIFVIITATLLAFGKRTSKSRWVKLLIDFCSVGYAVPGIVIAVGTLIIFTKVDNLIINSFSLVFGVELGLIFTGTIAALVFAHAVRFLSLGLQTVGSSLTKINESVDEVSRLLGSNIFNTLLNIHLPLIRSGILTAALLVFVEVMKELPATLIMRPFNFNTLSVRAYELATDERLADASTAALAIVLTGIIPVILLNISIKSYAGR
ncbi:MAG: ABC transporter permease subunit, partial [Pseudomonadota bacterium]